ncbi:MAG: hypothetical protein ABSD50_16345 [Smithella sp.]
MPTTVATPTRKSLLLVRSTPNKCLLTLKVLRLVLMLRVLLAVMPIVQQCYLMSNSPLLGYLSC